jgi:nitrite reductase/ring-hydroxylating ferredoxin subunit
MGLGIVAALPAAAAGAADWSDTEGAARRIGAVHAALNAAALTFYAASFVRRRRPGDGRWLAATGLALMAGGGWLGGHLAYALGVGVDTTAFETGPADWTAVGSADEFPVGQPVAVETGTARVVVLREAGDRLRAMANRCTHRGGPLAEGKIEDECATCPWHGSRFALADSEVRRGPATRPQPIYDVRLHRNQVEIRRARS